MLQSSIYDVNTYINIMKGRLINEKTRMFITLLHLFITLHLLFVNVTLKDWGLIGYTLLYYIYYLNVKVSCNFLPVVS